jgi:fructuronate reductase
MSMKRLSNATLDGLSPSVQRPGYDRASVTAGIVHLGIGAFHRAHQAVFIDDCLKDGAKDWGVIGASLRSADTRDALKPQDFLYTLAVGDSERRSLRVVGAVQDIVVAPENPAQLLEIMCQPSIRIVSLTVTEKAYLRNALGDLDFDHPDILADLADPERPRSIFGFIVGALEWRRKHGIAPFTVLSCDNLADNGRVLHRLLVAFAARRSPELAAFIEEHVACPSTMVDRIVPATTDEDRADIDRRLGMQDAWPVVCEPFGQWVIEDRFTLGRPELERHGVTFVRDVGPFELMKIRLLNGAHSAIAYLGLLLGHETVASAFADRRIFALVEGLWEELIPTLPEEEGLLPRIYIEDLKRRFLNAALRHRTAQIANDGSQKLPQRIIAATIDRLSQGMPADRLALVIAAWITALAQRPATGKFTDPLDGRLKAIPLSSTPGVADVAAVFALTGFADEATCRDDLVTLVAGHLTQLNTLGAARVVDALNSKGMTR